MRGLIRNCDIRYFEIQGIYSIIEHFSKGSNMRPEIQSVGRKAVDVFC